MSFRIKTILGITGIAGILLAVFVWNGLQLLVSSAEGELLKGTGTTARLFATTAKDAVVAGDTATLGNLSRDLLAHPDVVYVRVKDDQRVLVAEGDFPADGRPLVAEGGNTANTDGVLDVTADIVEGGVSRGQVELGFSTRSIRAVLEAGYRESAYLAVLAVLLSVVFSYALAVYLTRNLSALQEASHRISRGEMGVQVPVRGGDELALTAAAFNTMSLSLQRAWEENRIREEALEASEAGLAAAQRIARLGSWEWYIDGGVLRWSDEVYRVFGYQPREFAPSYDAFFMAVHPEDREQVQAVVDAVLKDGKPFSVDHRIVHPDGEVRIVHAEGGLYFAEEGRPRCMVGTVQDITEARRVEDSLRLSATVFDSSIEGVVITDAAARILRVNKAFTSITGFSEEEVINQTPAILRSGRHDRPFYQALWASLKEQGSWQGEIWNRRKNGEVYPEWLSISAITDASGKVTHYVGVFSDITEQKLTEERIRHLAHYDPLTDLPNRLLFHDRLKQALVQARRDGAAAALLYIGLDRFKTINDTLGHGVGDRLLLTMAQRLGGCTRDGDTVARLGGDEFCIILSQLKHPGDAAVAARKVIEALSAPVELEGHEAFLTASIGIACYPVDGERADELIKNADTAMGYTKQQGRNAYQFYRADMNAQALDRLLMESSLRYALEREQFVLHYQPQVNLDSGELVGMEALLRWQHPDLGLVPPVQFVPLLEESGMIVEVGEWVLRTACRQSRLWQEAGYAPLNLSVNLSPRQFGQVDLTTVLGGILEETGLAPEWLELEITENTLMKDVNEVITILTSLRDMGLRLSVDDFGTGYSSLAYLKRFPIQTLKIDRAFVRDVATDADDRAIVSAILAMAQSLKLQVIAEGVESEEQRGFLAAHACRVVQGFLFGKPMPAEEFEQLLRRGASAPTARLNP